MKAPGGGDTAGHPLREHLAHRCQDTEAQAFEADVLGALQDLGHFSALNVKLVGGKVVATKENPSGIVSDVQNLEKSSPDPPKSRPGASKIEPRGLQDAIFKRHLT